MLSVEINNFLNIRQPSPHCVFPFQMCVTRQFYLLWNMLFRICTIKLKVTLFWLKCLKRKFQTRRTVSITKSKAIRSLLIWSHKYIIGSNMPFGCKSGLKGTQPRLFEKAFLLPKQEVVLLVEKASWMFDNNYWRSVAIKKHFL